MKPRVSVVIPTIEEQALFGIINQIRKQVGKDTEIIVVDKSSDAYYNRVRKTGVEVIRQKGKGVEDAIMLGLRASHGDVLASIDADGTHDVKGIVDGIDLVEQGKADLVLGNRLSNPEKGAMSRYIKFGNAAISSIYSHVYGIRLHDLLVGLFVMKRSAFEKIRNMEPYRAGHAGVFAIELARRGGYRIVDVPIKYYPREEGESKLAKSKTVYGLGVASHIIRMFRDYNPLLIFGGIGIGFMVVGVALGLYVITNYLATGAFTLVGRSLIAFMLIIAGILSMIAGFILDLLLEIERRLEKME